MSKRHYDGPKEYRPLSAWSYVGYSILFAIPFIGLLLLIIFALSSRNINLRSYARSTFCWIILAVVVIVSSIVLTETKVIPDNWPQRVGSFVGDLYRGDFSKIGKLFTVKNQDSSTRQPSINETSVSVPTIKPIRSSVNAIGSISPTDRPISDKVASAVVTPSFKEAMDSYEAFFDEYVEFMNKYDSQQSSIDMLQDYTEYLTKYSDVMTKLDAIDEEELSDADDAYYLQVMLRINHKLAQVAYN